MYFPFMPRPFSFIQVQEQRTPPSWYQEQPTSTERQRKKTPMELQSVEQRLKLKW